jgi:caffeoyl-CoA O-methyltransferase
MFTGYSALAMAEALPAHGRVVACEIDGDVATFAQRCFDDATDGHKIDVRIGPANRTLAELAEHSAAFDLVFIDADKAGYLGYLNCVLDAGLIRPRGLICVDNTLMQGQPWMTGESSVNGSAIAAFNRSLAEDPRVEQVILPLRDGLTLVRRVDVQPARQPAMLRE